MTNKIQAAFKKYNFKSLNKALYYFRTKHPEVPSKEVKKYFESLKTPDSVRKINKDLVGKQFSNQLNTWQMDIYFSGKNPYLLFIGVNNRYAVIYKLKSKSTDDVLPVIIKFVEKYKPIKITSDNEKSFTSVGTVEYLYSKNINYKVILGQLHSALVIIDRLSRTINNMEMEPEKAVNIYNKTYHSTIKMTPKEMYDNQLKELIYIYDSIDNSKIDDIKILKRKTKVRYILDSDRKEKKFQKSRHKNELSKGYYLIEKIINPYRYVIIAKDGSIKEVPRYRLVKLNDPSSIKFASTIQDGSPFYIYEEILDYNSKTKKYTVIVISRDDSGEKIKEKVEIGYRQLREGNPTAVSELEQEFIEKNSEKYKLDTTTNQIIELL